MTGHEWPISGLSFSPDGRSVATGAFDAEIRIWDPTSGSLLRLLAGPSPIQALAYSPDGKRLVSAASDATTTLWDLTTGRELLHLVGHSGGPIGNVAFMPDGDRVVTSGLDATTRLWDVSVGGARDWLTVPGVQKILSEVTFSPDGAMFAAPAHPNGVSVWETATGKEVIRLAGPPQKLTALAFSPDGTKLVAGSDTTSAPPVWDVRTGKLLFTLDGQSGFIRAVAFSPDGTRIATGGSFDGGLHLWDARTGAAVSPGRRDFEGETLSLRYSPDGRLLVSGEGDLVRIRDAATLEPRRELTGFTGNPTGFAFGPDDMLAASDTDGTARVWDLGSGKELAVFRAHRGPVNQIAFSPDGTRIATGGEDGTTRLWEPRTGTETFQFVGHTSLVSGVSFSPDGRLLATASPDGTVALHVLPVDEFVTLARGRLTRGLTTAECRTYLHQQRCDP